MQDELIGHITVSGFVHTYNAITDRIIASLHRVDTEIVVISCMDARGVIRTDYYPDLDTAITVTMLRLS
jgi:hypothetical protein